MDRVLLVTQLMLPVAVRSTAAALREFSVLAPINSACFLPETAAATSWACVRFLRRCALRCSIRCAGAMAKPTETRAKRLRQACPSIILVHARPVHVASCLRPPERSSASTARKMNVTAREENSADPVPHAVIPTPWRAANPSPLVVFRMDCATNFQLTFA